MFCTKIKSKLKNLLRHFDNYVEAHIDTALGITYELKKILSSPIADILTALIPGEIDDTLRRQMISALNKVVEVLTIVDNCKEYPDVNDKLNCFVQQLKRYDPNLQDAILQKLASLLAGNLDGQRLKQSVYDLYTQAKYSVKKTGN